MANSVLLTTQRESTLYNIIVKNRNHVSHLSRNLHTQTVNPTTLRTFGRRGEKFKEISNGKHVQVFQLPREGRDMMKFTTRKFNRESLHSPFGGFCHSNAVQNSPPPQGLCDETRVQGQRTPSLTSAKIIHRLCLFFFLIRCLVFLSGTQPQFSSFISFAHRETILLAHSSLFKFCLNYKEI